MPESFVKQQKLDRHESKPEGEERRLTSSAAMEDGANGKRITIADDEGHEVRLNDLAPGVRFDAAPGAKGCGYMPARFNREREDFEPAVITFPPENINKLGGRLGLLHEISHYQYEGYHHFFSGYQDRLIDTARDIGNSILDSETYKSTADDVQRTRYYLREFQRKWAYQSRMGSGSHSPMLQYNDLVAAIPKLAELERDVWAHALVLRRDTLKQSGVDMFGGAKQEEVFRYIENTALRGYQELYGPLAQGSGSGHQRQDMLDRILSALERFWK